MKKRWKRAISATLAFAMLLAMLPASALAATNEAQWADAYVQAAQEKGWIATDSDAGKALTRGEFAVILWKALGSPAAQADCPFEDVEMGEVQTAVTALYSAGVVEDDGVTAFMPDSTLTRQAAFTMVARAYGLTAADSSAAAGYADWADVDDWAQDAMAALVEADIVSGVGGNQLAPAKDITLAEMLKIAVLSDAQDTCSIVSVSTLGFVDTDSAKVDTIVVEYDQDMTGANVGTAAYEVYNYGIAQGAGTADYNGFWMNMGGKSLLKGPNWKAASEKSADEAIEEVTTIAFMDIDGPKVKAIVVEYATELEAGAVDMETYAAYSYTNLE